MSISIEYGKIYIEELTLLLLFLFVVVEELLNEVERGEYNESKR